MHLTVKRPRKLKTANINPRVFEAKSRNFGDAKIFHFTVYEIDSVIMHYKTYTCYVYTRFALKVLYISALSVDAVCIAGKTGKINEYHPSNTNDW